MFFFNIRGRGWLTSVAIKVCSACWSRWQFLTVELWPKKMWFSSGFVYIFWEWQLWKAKLWLWHIWETSNLFFVLIIWLGSFCLKISAVSMTTIELHFCWGNLITDCHFWWLQHDFFTFEFCFAVMIWPVVYGGWGVLPCGGYRPRRVKLLPPEIPRNRDTTWGSTPTHPGSPCRHHQDFFFPIFSESRHKPLGCHDCILGWGPHPRFILLAPPSCDFRDLGLAGIMVGQHDILRQTNNVYNLTVLAAHLKKNWGFNHFDNQ